MKKRDIFLLMIFLSLLGVVIYFFIGASLSAGASSMTAPAADHPEAFASIQNILSSGAAPQQFAEAPASADRCTLIDTTIVLRNKGMFDAEWMDITVTGASGDIAVYSLSGEGDSVPAHSSGQVNVKLISHAPAGTPRTYTVHYYVLGMPRSITVTA